MSKDNEKELLNKVAGVSGTQSRYEDANGVEFSAQEIASGGKHPKPWKLKSLSDRVNNKDFGKVKKSK